MQRIDPRIVKAIGIVIAAALLIAGLFGIQIDIPVIDPAVPVQ